MTPLGSTPANRWRVDAGTADLVRPAVVAKPLCVAAEPQDVVLDLARTAIVVVDMQNDFLSPGGWMDTKGVDLAPVRRPIAAINALLPALRAAGVPVVWLNWGVRPDRLDLPPTVLHAGNRDGRGIGYGDPLPDGRGRVLERGGWGAAIADGLDVAPGDVHVDKNRLSGFWNSDLDAVLRNLGTTTLLFAGVNMDRCVLATLQDAAFLGYDCLLVEDCTATASPAFCVDAVRFLVKQLYGFLTTGAAIRAGLG